MPIDIDAPQPTDSAGQDPVAARGTLTILPMRNLVLFPGSIQPITIARQKFVSAAQEAIREGGRVGLVLQKDPQTEEPSVSDLYGVGTVANVLRYMTGNEDQHHLICQGEARFRIRQVVSEEPQLVVRYEVVEESGDGSGEVQARVHVLQQQASRAIELSPQVPPELATALRSVESPGLLCDLIAGFLDIPAAEKQALLETFHVRKRLDTVVEHMARRLEVLELSHEIQEETRASIDERQREAVLREQLRTIQSKLGEDEGDGAEIEALAKAIADAGMPEDTEEHARKELARLRRMPGASSEYSMLRNYLDWLTELPWSKLDKETIDVERARRILDEDHYGLTKIKSRIIEYLAVRKLNPYGRSPILCFVGPPGVGKTSLGQSIARAIGLRFVRASLGGVHDEAEIRGHRRTYIGALPGKIIQSIKKAGTRNPVFMLDEIDKLGRGVHGDPSSALLEVLDPEQNSTFQDNYLGATFDLSKVLFIATANRLDTISPPLLDRMEVIELSGYTVDEKLQIAKRYLLDRQLRNHGLKDEDLDDKNLDDKGGGHERARERVEITDEALVTIITQYTRESGCRNLEKQIGAVLRHVAVSYAEGRREKTVIDREDVLRILGAPKFEDEVALRTGLPGVATGMAWTPVGGDILFVESTRTPGDGKLILTGQLGDVMKESAQAAMSLIKGRYEKAASGDGSLRSNDVHIHVPAGAIPKDGPSAGVAIFVSLASLVTNRTVRHDVAMTGEISLRGQVLPVGGIKEKVIAAHRAGIRTVLLPDRNRKDFEDIPESVRNTLEFVWLETVDDAVEAALEDGAAAAARRPNAERVPATESRHW